MASFNTFAIQTEQLSNQVDRSRSQIIGWSYMLYVLGFNFMPLLLAWVCRRDRITCAQLLQAGLFQLPFSLLRLGLFCASMWQLFEQQGTAGFTKTKLLWDGLLFVEDLLPKIIMFILGFKALSGELVKVFYFDRLAENIMNLWRKKSIKSAQILNYICPGFGMLYLGRSFVGWILMVAFLFTVSIFGFFILAYFKTYLAQSILSIAGFYLKVNDYILQTYLLSPLSLLAWGVFLSLIYIIAYRLTKNRYSLSYRRIVGSVVFSYILALFMLSAVFVTPYMLNKSNIKESISQRAAEIFDELDKLEEQKKFKAQRLKDINKEKSEREMHFDLVLTENIDGINDFSSKPFVRQRVEKEKVSIGYSDRDDLELPNIQTYKEEQTRSTKSYSEYITAKVREDARDEVIWENTHNLPYSMVVEYWIEPNGYISTINIVESSRDKRTDATVISVIESMSPMVMPPVSDKRLKVVELFWNTGHVLRMPTSLQDKLKNYPDGRIIFEEDS